MNDTTCRGSERDNMESIISQMEQGILVTKFYKRKKPEDTVLKIRRETRQILWTRDIALRYYDGAVDMNEVKEIKFGKDSKDFEKWPENAKKFEPEKCFVVHWGSQFCLNTTSIAVSSEADCQVWVKGLRYLVDDTVNSSYPQQVESWLRKEFYSMSNSQDVVTLKAIKAFLSRVINYTITTSALFYEIDTAGQRELNFDDFEKLYQKLICDCVHSVDWHKLVSYLENGRTINCQEFQNFLLMEQRDPLGNNYSDVSRFMKEYRNDPNKDGQEPVFTVPEFISFLYSKQNEIWDPKNDECTQDMTRPLCHYWIASSHNTYLTGHQLLGESSCEAYARALKAGCRCIEVDCWNGPDEMPVVFHGNTKTTKIKFTDVIKTIKEYAFVSSDYPVILSLEDHCTLSQQRKMATEMRQVFGDMLLTERIDENETALPSPSVLRRKILLKHRKLPDSASEKTIDPQNDCVPQEMDLSNTVKSGFLYVEDKIDRQWNPCFFVLTEEKLYYTETFTPSPELNQDEDEENSIQRPVDGVVQDELHYGETWFHGMVENGRAGANELLTRYAYLGDGTFLVRQSLTFATDFCISVWHKEKPHHFLIRFKEDMGHTKFWFTKNHCFDSLYSLITYYRSHPLGRPELNIKLRNSVPQPRKHEEMNWWHADCTRGAAEDLLKEDLHAGVFLVRPSEKKANEYTISFRAETRAETGIEHCRIKLEGRLYTIGELEFENLIELINYYMEHPFYRNSKLTHPVGHCPGTLNETDAIAGTALVSSTSGHMDLNDSASQTPEKMMTGNLQKCLDINGADVNLLLRADRPGLEHILEIVSPRLPCGIFEMASPSVKSATEWKKRISEVAQNTSDKHRKMEQACRIAQEISDLTIYGCTVPFSIDRVKNKGLAYCEMSSFNDTRAEKLICQQEKQFFIKYHQFQFSRVYPACIPHFDSSNYNPVPMWNSGSQMVALNYQTGDKPMQLNHAKFRENGGCGYLLKPDFMFDENFDPCDKSALDSVDTLKFTLKIIGGRHLSQPGKGTICPFVEVEVVGADFDEGVKLTTRSITDNGFNPIWDESCEFEIANPDLAMLRFIVQDEDMFEKSVFLGQATFPVRCLRRGYRSVPLKNSFSEDLTLASLLVHINVTIPQ